MNEANTSRAKGLTRLAVLVAAIISAVVFFSTPSAQASNEANTGASYTYVTVGVGESLWQLAEEFAPELDPREAVEAIVSLNNLTEATIQPGQRIALPKF